MENNKEGLIAQIKKDTTNYNGELTLERFKGVMDLLNKAEKQPYQQIAYKELFEHLDDAIFILYIKDKNIKWVCGEDTYNYIEERYNKIKNENKNK